MKRFGMDYFITAAMCAIIIFAMSSSAAARIIYVKWNSPGSGAPPVFDGQSWGTAFHKVQDGLNAASSGDEVWVAGDRDHPYYERIALKKGAGLYGGFSGTETSRYAGSFVANVTILDGQKSGSVVTSPSGATTTTVIAGFTIRNGNANSSYGGGGISCYYSSPTISNNTITANTASYRGCGGGIFCLSSSPTITNNTITANTASSSGGGIYCTSSSPMIANNTIMANGSPSGGGIFCLSSSPTITNNTITANTASSSGGGIYCSAPFSPKISNNVVAFNSSGLYNSQGATPVLRNNCVYNPSGYNYAGLSPGQGDISTDPKLVAVEYGQVHIQPDSPCRDAGDDSAVQPGWLDMDGQARIRGLHVDIGADESDSTFTPVIVRVSPTGDDANDGSSWALAKRSVQAGADAASAWGGEVWVAAGTYNERIVLPAYAYLYGGFAGTENSRDDRNWRANTTVLDGAHGGAVVSPAPGFRLSRIDGFTIRNGRASNGGGIFCEYSSPTISNNTITANTASSSGGGIFCAVASPTIWNNVIAGNSAASGGGIRWLSASPTILNNTIAANSASSSGGGMSCGDFSSELWNNIIAFNSSGIYNGGGAPTLRCNDVYGNTSYNYSGLSPGMGDISLDPMFLNRGGGDYHLLSGSPCIDTGTNTGEPDADLDGAIRPQDGNGDGTAMCEIGAYEYPLDLLKAKKMLSDGTLLTFGVASVTALFPPQGRIYVERTDRSSGIRVDTSQTFDEGKLVNVQGAIQTDPASGERYVSTSAPWPKSTGGSAMPRSLFMPGRELGGGTAGLQDGVWSKALAKQDDDGYEPTWAQSERLNNIGLLVTICGTVTYSATDYFYADDGSALDDGSGHKGVKVLAAGLTLPASGLVKVTGISSCEKNGDRLVRVLKVRKQADILPL